MSVTSWYIDIISVCIGIVLAVTLSIITFRNLSKLNKYPVTIRFLVYATFVSCITQLLMYLFQNVSLEIAASIAPNSNQIHICFFANTFGSFNFGIHNFLLNLLLIKRLNLAFQNSLFSLSKYTYYGYIIIFSILWIIILSTYYILFPHDVAPYNMYTQLPDKNGNGTSCSLLSSKLPIGLTIAAMCIMSAIFYGNLIVWILFTKKLYNLLKQTWLLSRDRNLSVSVSVPSVTKVSTSSTDVCSDEFVSLMKHQTFLIGVLIFSTICCWTLQMFIPGYFFMVADIISTIFVVFLTFKMNKYYFKLFKCDKCSSFCCGWFEKKVQKRLMNNNESDENIEPKLSKIIQNKPSNTNSINTSSAIEITMENRVVNNSMQTITEIIPTLTPVHSLCKIKLENHDSNVPIELELNLENIKQ